MTDNAIVYDLVIPDDEAIVYLRRIAEELHRALNDTADTTAKEPRLDAALHPATGTRRERAI